MPVTAKSNDSRRTYEPEAGRHSADGELLPSQLFIHPVGYLPWGLRREPGRFPMTQWTATSLPDMTGRTVMITGASSGIGLVAAQEFARVGARVIAAVRNIDKGRRALADSEGTVELRCLDVSSLASIHQFAERWSGELDILVNNAGIVQVPLSRTSAGSNCS